MNKNYILTAFAACALLATSCTNDDNNLNNQDQSVSILTTVSGNTVLTTRADATSAYTPEGGTLTLLYGSMTAPANEQATYTCTAGNWTPSGTPLYWDKLTAGANGKYAFFAVAPNMPAAAPAVATNQSVAADYVKSDLLIAYTPDTKLKENVSLTFRHVLTQLTVTLKAEDGAADSDLSSATLTAAGARIAYNVSSTAPTAEVPATATATGDAAATLTPNKADGKFYLVLPPQALAAKALTITITIGASTYTWQNTDALTLAAAQNNTINLTVKKSGINLGGINITDWDNSPAPINGNANNPDILLPASSLNLPEAGTLTLAAFKDATKQGSNATYPVAYDASKPDGQRATINTADAAYAPLKWEDLAKYTAAGSSTLQTYAYTALFVPTAPAATDNHERQYLCGTTAATAWGTAPAFTGTDHSLKQLMSRLVVKLAFSADFSDADKASAALSVVRKKKVTAVSLDATAQATVATADVAAAEAAVSLVADAADALAFSATLCPQQLADQGDKYITLTLNGGTATEQSYILKADAAGFTLSPGQQHTLTLSISKTGLAIGSLSIAPWTETTGNGNLDWE